jgi:hypothetical protein
MTEVFLLSDETLVSRKEALRRTKQLQESAQQILQALKPASTQDSKPITEADTALAAVASEEQSPEHLSAMPIRPPVAVQATISDFVTFPDHGNSQSDDGWMDALDSP